jgi:NADPH-dependent 2,4-dienoyl-CoA reductase/sulfur reductase-like enzyme
MVVGAGLVGMETAVHLLEEGCRVIVLEEKETPPVSPLTSHGYFLHRLVREKGELRLGTKLVEIRKGGVLVEGEGGRREVEAEWIVWAVGSRPRRGLAEAAAAKGLRVEEAGDTVEPRRLLEAVHEGYEAAGLLLEKRNRR